MHLAGTHGMSVCCTCVYVLVAHNNPVERYFLSNPILVLVIMVYDNLSYTINGIRYGVNGRLDNLQRAQRETQERLDQRLNEIHAEIRRKRRTERETEPREVRCHT